MSVVWPCSLLSLSCGSPSSGFLYRYMLRHCRTQVTCWLVSSPPLHFKVTVFGPSFLLSFIFHHPFLALSLSFSLSYSLPPPHPTTPYPTSPCVSSAISNMATISFVISELYPCLTRTFHHQPLYLRCFALREEEVGIKCGKMSKNFALHNSYNAVQSLGIDSAY